MEFLSKSISTLALVINVMFGHTIYPGRMAAAIGKHRFQAGAQPSRIIHKSIKPLVPPCWLSQRALRKLLLDFQDLCRIHD